MLRQRELDELFAELEEEQDGLLDATLDDERAPEPLPGAADEADLAGGFRTQLAFTPRPYQDDALAAWLARRIQDGLGAQSSAWPLFALIALGQAVLCWRTIVRGARYSAVLQVSHQLVRPLARPNPWKKTIGGPGGPRYPVDDGEDFGVSL